MYLLSQIDKPIIEPQLANVELILADGPQNNVVTSDVETIVVEILDKIPDLYLDILDGQNRLY